MEIKRDILWRVYLAFVGILLFAGAIIGRAVYIQQVQGSRWREMAREQQQHFEPIDAERGTIYSEDGNMLSTSIPYFDIYIDFAADGLREKNGQRFFDNLDSLSYCLARLFQGNARQYKRILEKGYASRNRYWLLKRNISFRQYQALRQFPLVRQGKNKSGFIAEVKSKRLNPYQLLANRTIGLSREYIDSDGKVKNSNVGLEDTYDSLLRGESGQRLMKYMAGGVYVPVEGSEIEPENGKDIVTTIDVNFQDIVENALLKMMEENECEHGTCIVMEVRTGKIKAIANLGRDGNGNYWEDLNYAIRASEPGSTFKLATLLSLLEDKYVTLNDKVDLEGGKWQVGRRTVFDSEPHGLHEVTVEQAFEHSSNVGMAKLATRYYSKNPEQFIDHLKQLRLNLHSGIDINGESNPIIKNPQSRTWSATSLPWMSFGYEVLISPLQTLMLYNAVANNGTMMKPYLVNGVQENGRKVADFQPEILKEHICSDETLQLLRTCLEGVCQKPGGTGYTLFQGTAFSVAGKTGTALVADRNRGYSDHIYQSSFAGYFPADDPEYSCIVVIRNKPFAKKYYGASVAGPVFKEVATRLYALSTRKRPSAEPAITRDSTAYYYAGSMSDLKTVLNELQVPYRSPESPGDWAALSAKNDMPVMEALRPAGGTVPDVRGMGLKDALYLLEKSGLEVAVEGKGKVMSQSLTPGTAIAPHKLITIALTD